MNFLTLLITLIAVGYVLVIGKSLLVPLIIAIYVLFIVKALSNALSKRLTIQSAGVCHLLAFIILFTFIIAPIELVLSSVDQILEIIPVYEQNFFDLLSRIFSSVPINADNLVRDVQENVPLTAVITALASGLSSYTSNLFLVLLYILFLASEQHIIMEKIKLLIADTKKRKSFFTILEHINIRITKYLWYKTVVSFATAIASYAIMQLMGLDFAGFWAMVIFLFNFIPSIGSVIATLFPTILAAIQFEAIWPILAVFFGIGCVQFIIGNLIEPRLMGKVLNLSPLTILISLILWGSIWGITGMFVAVPITVSLLIIFSEFNKTRPIAIMLSSTGEL